MPKCSWIRSRGANKGKACGNYTRWKVDGEFYCTAHKNMIKNTKSNAVIYHDTTINTLEKRIKELEKQLEERNKPDPVAEIQEQEIFDMSCTEVIGSDTDTESEDSYQEIVTARAKAKKTTKTIKTDKKAAIKSKKKKGFKNPLTFEEIMNLKFED